MDKLTPQEEEQLKLSVLVQELTQHKGWLEWLKPLLESKVRHSWVDPAKSSDLEAFFKEYTVAFGWSKACMEILALADQEIAKGKYLQDKKDGKIKDNFRIGS